MDRNINSNELAKELFRRAQAHEREAKKLYEAAKVLNPNINEVFAGAQLIKETPELFPAKKTRKEQVIELLVARPGLQRKELREALPDMPAGTLAFLLSHEKATFVVHGNRWYIKGKEPQAQNETLKPDSDLEGLK